MRNGGRDRFSAAKLTLLALGKAATAAFAMDAVIAPEHPKFHGKAMRIRALGYFGVLLALPVAWWARGPREPYPAGADLMLTVPLLLDAGGNSMGAYDRANIDRKST